MSNELKGEGRREGNKLIAEFMEYPTAKPDLYELFGPEQYDLSWDKVMSVVDKLEAIGCSFIISSEVTQVSKHYYKSRRHKYPEVEYIKQTSSESRIASTWQAIVEFIKWYNSELKPPNS